MTSAFDFQNKTLNEFLLRVVQTCQEGLINPLGIPGIKNSFKAIIDTTNNSISLCIASCHLQVNNLNMIYIGIYTLLAHYKLK